MRGCAVRVCREEFRAGSSRGRWWRRRLGWGSLSVQPHWFTLFLRRWARCDSRIRLLIGLCKPHSGECLRWMVLLCKQNLATHTFLPSIPLLLPFPLSTFIHPHSRVQWQFTAPQGGKQNSNTVGTHTHTHTSTGSSTLTLSPATRGQLQSS